MKNNPSVSFVWDNDAKPDYQLWKFFRRQYLSEEPLMRQVVLAMFMFLSSSAVIAAEDQTSGTYWLSLCSQKQHDYACAYYINGLVEGLTIAVTETSLVSRGDAHKVYGYCPPATTSVGDMKSVFIKYLNDNPANRKYTGSSLALDAWRKAWPCKK